MLVDVVRAEDEDVVRLLVGDEVAGSGRSRRPLPLNQLDPGPHLRGHRLHEWPSKPLRRQARARCLFSESRLVLGEDLHLQNSPELAKLDRTKSMIR